VITANEYEKAKEGDRKAIEKNMPGDPQVFTYQMPEGYQVIENNPGIPQRK